MALPADPLEPSKGELTRRSVLDAAIARFGRDGYRATSVAAIARDAGVGGTVAYAYFESKEDLFLAALDADAAAVIDESRVTVFGSETPPEWRQRLILTLVESVERHPLARRALAGLEPEVTDRVLEIPALAELRGAVAERIRAEQAAGSMRPDIDADVIGSGLVSLVLSVLMSVVQVGTDTALRYGPDVIAVFEAALDPVPPTTRRRRRT